MKIQILKTLVFAFTLFMGAAFYAQEMETITIEETDASISTEADDQTDIVSYLSNSDDHTTLAKAVQSADLVSTLSGEGPFTVFAPTNNAFKALPHGKLAKLLIPENKGKLGNVLKSHVIAGEVTAEDIMQAIEAGNGKAEFKTIGGESLTASIDGANVVLTDANGNTSKVSTTDVIATNGVIHVVDSVILPLKKGTYTN